MQTNPSIASVFYNNRCKLIPLLHQLFIPNAKKPFSETIITVLKYTIYIIDYNKQLLHAILQSFKIKFDGKYIIRFNK